MKWRRIPTGYLDTGFTAADSSVPICQSTRRHISEDRSIKLIFFGPRRKGHLKTGKILPD
jgi:hypothetical protein